MSSLFIISWLGVVWLDRRMKLPIVREDYLVDCFKRQKKLPFDSYKVEASGGVSSMVTVKVKGRSAVHEASGMQDTGHILEDGKSIYNTTLNMSDLSTGVNRLSIMSCVFLWYNLIFSWYLKFSLVLSDIAPLIFLKFAHIYCLIPEDELALKGQ